MVRRHAAPLTGAEDVTHDRREGPTPPEGSALVTLKDMPRTNTTARRARGLVALLLAAALPLAGCSDETEPAAGSDQPAESSEPAPEPKLSPLTGERVAHLPRHRAVAVKIENTSGSEPQVGLGSADLVVRELVEGGLTRLVAFYYTSLPRQVGPVRSARATDIGLVKPPKAVLVAAGGAPRTKQRLRRNHVVTVGEGTRGIYRVSDRPAPYNLFANLRKLPDDKVRGPRPDAYLPWGRAAALGAGRPARKVTTTFSAAESTDWTWTGRYWTRSGSHAPDSDEFRPENLLVLEVRQTDAGYLDPAGNPVPESVLAGKGSATLFHDGSAYRATWVKKAHNRPFSLVTAKGEKVPVPPGHTWIELVPAGGGDVEFGR